MRRSRVDGPVVPIPDDSPGDAILNQTDLVRDKLIGSGSCGDVFLGRYLPTGQQVAIKVISGLEKSEHDLMLFRREIEIHQTVKHRFLVPFMGFTDQSPYSIVTRYMPNGSLYDFLHIGDSPPLTAVELAQMAYAVAVGMNFLHQKNVIHRDLKSPNILLDEDKLPKICDFGLARVVKPDPMTKLIGTPQWMAPEIVKNEGYNEKVDIYSYGVVLWEMLTGEIPFAGQSPFQIVYALTVDTMPFTFPEDAPEALVQLIQSCCHRNPAKRPSFQTIIKQFDIAFPGCKSAEFEAFRVSVSFKPPLRMLAHRATTPPINRRTCSAVPGTSQLSDEVAVNLAALRSSDPSKIANAVLFFEEFEDLPRLADAELWAVFLPFYLTNRLFEARVADLLLKFARVSSVLVTIANVPGLHTYIHPQTLDLFLYVVGVAPVCMGAESRSQLMRFATRTGTPESLKSIILLCKLCPLHAVTPEIVAFFRSIAGDFADEIGGHLILRQIFVEHIQNSLSGESPIDLVRLYFNSKIEENAIAAYHCIFVLDIPCDFVTVDQLNSHLKSGGKLSECALDLIRRHRELATPDGLIEACMSYGSDKALLLLCDIAASDPQSIVECAPRWLSATKSHAVRWLPLLLVISQDHENTKTLIKYPELSPFISEVLKYGTTDAFVAVCYFLKRVEISKPFWQQLDKAAIFHLLSQKLKTAAEPLALKLAAEAFRTLAAVGYSSGFGAVVRFLLKKSIEIKEAAAACVFALGELVKHTELKSVFRLFNAIQTLEPFQNEPELAPTIEFITESLTL
jgi:serine/threonine protein kinase